MNRIRAFDLHLTFWGEACDNEKLQRKNARRFAEWAELLEQYLAPIVPRGEVIRREAMLLMGLIDGFALRLVLQTMRGDRIHAQEAEIVAAVRSHLREMQARYR